MKKKLHNFSKTWTRFQEGEGSLRAAALTYQSMLALMPLLALISVTAGQFGYVELLLSGLRKLDRRWELDLPFETFAPIIEHLKAVQFSTLGWMGLLSVLFIFVVSMSHLEKAFNVMWGLDRHRNWLRRIRLYLPILALFLMMVIVLARLLKRFLSAMQALVEQGIPLQEQIEAGSLITSLLLLASLVFLLLYKNIPYARIEWKPAILASFFTSILSFSNISVLIYFQTWLFNRYSAVYGSMAVLPILLLAFYIQWFLILLGCAFSRQIQEEVHQK